MDKHFPNLLKEIYQLKKTANQKQRAVKDTYIKIHHNQTTRSKDEGKKS